MQLNRTSGEAAVLVFRVWISRAKRVRIVVQNLRRIFGHQPLEDAIEHIDERAARAEVVLEVDHFAKRLVTVAESVGAGEESRRLGKTEAVNALLDVANAKQVLHRRIC